VLRERREQAAVHLLRLQRYAVVLHRESAEERTFTAKRANGEGTGPEVATAKICKRKEPKKKHA
jgi:hypothetical protein